MGHSQELHIYVHISGDDLETLTAIMVYITARQKEYGTFQINSSHCFIHSIVRYRSLPNSSHAKSGVTSQTDALTHEEDNAVPFNTHLFHLKWKAVSCGGHFK